MFNPWVRKIPWRRKWHPLQHSCLRNPMDRGAWWATVHGVTKQTQLSHWACRHGKQSILTGDAIMDAMLKKEGKWNGLMYIDAKTSMTPFPECWEPGQRRRLEGFPLGNLTSSRGRLKETDLRVSLAQQLINHPKESHHQQFLSPIKIFQSRVAFGPLLLHSSWPSRITT